MLNSRFDRGDVLDQSLTMRKGQNIAGHAIGVVHLEVWYPLLPGNVVNATSYDFPIRYRELRGATIPRILAADPALLDLIIEAGLELQREGVRALVGACGYFANYQCEVANALDIPVFLSSLLQVPLVHRALKPQQQIGILFADDSAVNSRMLTACGIGPDLPIVYRGLQNAPEFRNILDCTGTFHYGRLEAEVVGAAQQLIADNPGVGAIVLECSDLPPFAWAIQRAVGLPVFDFNSLINWIYYGVVQRRYVGFV